jgi:hypothetical protein
MSKATEVERTKLLSLCRDFVKAELNQLVSATELNKQLVIAAWDKIKSFVKDKATARHLAASEVAKQYLKG